ncbi:MAG: GNAT family N-acetyltransferase [Bacteroidales bacterium]
MILEKQEYPLFAQKWWWDAVAKDSYQTIEIFQAGELIAYWPLYKTKRFRLVNLYAQAPLTAHTGPYLRSPKESKESKESKAVVSTFNINSTNNHNYKQEYLSLLIDQLPKGNIDISISPGLYEDSFFRKKGFTIEHKLTYQISDLTNLEKVFSNIKSYQQRQIKKAEKQLKLVENPNIEDLIILQQETFDRQKRKNPVSAQTIRNLYTALLEHKAGKLLALADGKGQILACGLFVYDSMRCYSLIPAYKKTEVATGAGSLLQWEGIKFASQVSSIFDFEGSSIESIAHFNRSFGAEPLVFYRIYRHSHCYQFFNRMNQIRSLIRLR